MSMEVERDLVEAYFESNGFLVRQTTAYEAVSEKKRQMRLPSLAVFNPLSRRNETGLDFRLFTGDLPKIRSGLVGLLGWENSSFSQSVLTSDARILKFCKKEVNEGRVTESLKSEPGLMGSGFGDFLRLIVVPGLPKADGKLMESYELLKSAGVDGVFTLRSIMENLLRQTIPSKSYQGKSVFQIMRLMKAYDLVREPQLEMFPNPE